MTRFYSKTEKLSGWPTCHFVMERTADRGPVAVGIVHKTAASARKDANLRNAQ